MNIGRVDVSTKITQNTKVREESLSYNPSVSEYMKDCKETKCWTGIRLTWRLIISLTHVRTNLVAKHMTVQFNVVCSVNDAW